MGELTMSLYEKIIKAGIPHKSHYSDLYVPDCAEIQELIRDYEFNSNVCPFVSDIDGTIWLDIPFAYEPYWEARGLQKGEEICSK